MERNVLEGFKVGKDNLPLSHLQFANDTFFFFGSSIEESFVNLNKFSVSLRSFLG